MKPYGKQQIIYTREWLYALAIRFFRDAARSMAFGVLMSVSILLLFGVPLYLALGGPYAYETPAPNTTTVLLLYIFIGLPLCIGCWWAALEVADDRHWVKPAPTIWDNQRARCLEYTLRYVQYLESKGTPVDRSLVLSGDIRSAAHKLIDTTDDATVRFLLAAIMANSVASTSPVVGQLEGK